MIPPTPPPPDVFPGRYRHFKGGEYEVLGLARHSETAEWLVIYRPVESGTWWARPAAMFAESVTHNGEVQPRFRRLADGGN